MSERITIHEENDIVWTMREGALTAWQVQDGYLRRVDPKAALDMEGSSSFMSERTRLPVVSSGVDQ